MTKIQSPFQQARIKLTMWYVIMFTILIGIFTYLTLQAKQSAYIRVYQVVNTGSPGSKQVQEFSDTFEKFNQTFRERLLGFDVGLFVVSTWLAYVLSGKTLQPIKNMLNEQQTFAADVSHSLRTPLSTISLELEAYERSQKRISLETKALLNSIKEEVFSMTQLTSGMLALVRSGTDAYKTKFTEVKLNQLMEAVVQKMNPLAQAKNQNLSKELGDEATVWGNSDSLRQVFYILLDNAVKYSGCNSTITTSIIKHRSLVNVIIKDNGRGIPTKDLPHIFNRFYRADKKTKGTGLGLAIAAKLVVQHEGQIKVKSQENQGTSFTLTFPLRPEMTS
jgi:signal transduction histidine kinase